MKEQIHIFDTTLRDGEQCPGAAMNVEQKIQVAMQLETLGVDIIKAGFPVISDGDFRAVRAVDAGGKTAYSGVPEKAHGPHQGSSSGHGRGKVFHKTGK